MNINLIPLIFLRGRKKNSMQKRRNKPILKLGVIFIILIFSLGLLSASYSSFTDQKTTYGQYNIAEDIYYLCLEGYWPFDENEGDIAYDQSINQNNGSLQPDILFGPSWDLGKIDYALDFDGINDYVTISDHPSLDITDEITIMTWVNADTWDNPGASLNVRNILDKGEHESTRGYTLYSYKQSEEDFKLHFRLNKENNADVSTNLPNTDEWVYIAATYDGEFIKLFINGDKAAEKPYTDPIQTNDQPLYIGGGVNRDYWFDGTIDEVKIYSCALTEIEIEYIYDSYT